MKRFLLAFDDSIYEGENAKAAALRAAESDAAPMGATLYMIDLDWLVCHASGVSTDGTAAVKIPDAAPVQRFAIGAETLPIKDPT